MGQKINPFGYRLGITENHRSKWFSDSNKVGERYRDFVLEDDQIRKDHDWELFDRLSPRKRQNIINLNSGQLFEILVKDWISYLLLFVKKDQLSFFK